MSVRLRLLNLWHRVVTKPMFRVVKDPVLLRVSFELGRRLFRPPPGFWCERAILSAGGHRVAALWVGSGKPRDDRVVLYVHGGGFVAGSARSYAKFAAILAGRLGGRALVPDYRLAPEHRFPAACEDVLASYRALLEAGTDPGRIVVIGDSAGGNLVLGLLAEICGTGLPRPAACVAICPVTDLTYSGESFVTHAGTEVVLPVQRADDLNAAYLGDVPADTPAASPLFAAFPGCPPVLIQVGSKEILLSDAERMAARLRSFGVDVTLDVFADCPHVWHLAIGYLPEAETAVAEIADFCAKRLAD